MLPRALAFTAFAAFAVLSLTGCSASTTSKVGTAVEPTKSPLTLTYLGVAGWEMTDGAHTLLVDPYFSRLDVESDDVTIEPDSQAIAHYAPARADVVLVEHSHYDHLLDVPAVALATGAMVVGTESTFNVLRAAGVPERQLVVARGHERLELGAFSVRAIPGLHSLIGKDSAPIPRDVKLPMTAGQWAEGGTLQYLVHAAGRSVLFIGSANFIEAELTGLRPDVAVIATGLREKIPDYSCRLMRALGNPPLVLTDHFDAHWQPLGPKQMDIGDNGRASLAAFADEIHRCAPSTKVVVPAHLQPMSI
jgi:L-ascorbate metabolism protein UlaG (beta-lactamase superfamily)